MSENLEEALLVEWRQKMERNYGYFPKKTIHEGFEPRWRFKEGWGEYQTNIWNYSFILPQVGETFVLP